VGLLLSSMRRSWDYSEGSKSMSSGFLRQRMEMELEGKRCFGKEKMTHEYIKLEGSVQILM